MFSNFYQKESLRLQHIRSFDLELKDFDTIRFLNKFLVFLNNLEYKGYKAMAAHILAVDMEVCFRKTTVPKPLIKYPSNCLQIVHSCLQIRSYNHQIGN